MTTRKLILPFIPNPPLEYDQVYTQQSIRSITQYLRNMQTPGDARHTQIVLTNATTDGTTVEGNTIIIDDATGFLTLNAVGIPVSATGGTITTYTSGSTDYKVHTFLSTANFVLTTFATVDILVVGGGGSGGKSAEGGGGGGAGGVITATGLQLPPGTYTATVGDGGTVPASNGVGGSGGDSSFVGFVAKGGGGGGSQEGVNGADGGSGGGSGGIDAGSTAGGSTETYGWPYVFRSQEGYVAPTNYENLSQGNNGGTTTATTGDIGSGGGGAGAAGGSATVNSGPAGNGGDGVQNAFRTGSNVYYGGGGGGGTNVAGSGGLGGQGGGGRGAQNVSPVISAVAGTANTGGGGGGGSTATYDPGAGGSGIIVVRYTV